MNILIFMIGLILSMSFYGFGEYLSKKYSINNSFGTGFFAVICYAINAMGWLMAFNKFNSLIICGNIWGILYCFVTIFIGIYVFKESASIYQFIGIGLSIISMILMSYK
jgi:hypothetical protein